MPDNQSNNWFAKGFLWSYLLPIGINAVVAAAVAIYVVQKGHGGDPPPEDRPPIVVLDGSILFQGGDSLQPGKGFKNWKHMAAGSWRPDHNRGASVTDFTVFVGGGIDTGNCAQTTMTGDPVTIEFVPDPNAPQRTTTFNLTRQAAAGSSPKMEPDLASSESLANTTSASSPPQLEADPSGVGYISKVTVGSMSCALLKPGSADQRKAQRVTIQPNR